MRSESQRQRSAGLRARRVVEIVQSSRRARRPALRLIGLALLAAGVARAAIPPAEKILPSDTLFVLTIPDCAKMRTIYEKSPQSRFWNDAAMKPFRDKFIAQLKEQFIAPLERDLGVKFDDYSALPQGQLTLAI